jgi:mono/diheme cytochrome c family protein
MKRILLTFIASILFFLLTACTFSLAGDITPPPGYQAPEITSAAPTSVPVNLNPPLSAPDPEVGSTIYSESCAPCHGPTGQGDGSQADNLPNPAPAIGDPQLARPVVPLDWYSVITQGRMDRFMPPFSSLTDQQRWDVLAYVFSLSTADDLSQGQLLYEQNCSGCHGDTGRGDGPDSLAMAITPRDLTSPDFFAERSMEQLFQVLTSGAGNAMPAYESTLSEQERWSLAGYVRSLAFPAPVGEIHEAATAQPSGINTGEEATALADVLPGEETTLTMGEVTGQVQNGSGGEIPPAISVVLHGFDQIQEVYTATTTTDPDGSFTFDNVEMPESRIFMVTIDFNQATFNSDIAVVEAGTHAVSLPVTIYDTSADTSMLFVDRLHIFVESVDPDSLHMIELYLISNPTDKVIVGPGRGDPVIYYSLPEDATNLRFQQGTSGDRFKMTEEGFADTMGVPPGSGQYQVMFAYDLPYDRKAEVDRRLTLPVNSAVLLVPNVGLKVKSDQFEDNGVDQFDGESYQVYSSERFDAGSMVSFTVSGTPGTTDPSLQDPGEQTRLLAGALILSLSLVIVGLWGYRRYSYTRKNHRSDQLVPVMEESSPAQGASEFPDVDSVLDAIIALDDLHQAGQLSDPAYMNRRHELFEILKRKKEA